MSTATGGLSLRERLPVVQRWPERLPRVQRVTREEPPRGGRVVVSYALTAVSSVLLVLLVNLTLVSQLQHFASQKELYGELRLALAEGSTPIGQVDDLTGELVEPGTALALLEIPELGVREVVVEGTTSQDTKLGVGHRRDTPMPGQPGVSVLMGRAAAYGGVFGDLADLDPGDGFTVTTGQGVVEYRVIGLRSGESTQLPALAPEDGRLTMTTASGRAFQPTGALRVDAEQVSETFPRPPVAFAPGVIDDSEQAMAGDPSRLFSLSWLLQLLLALAVATVWAWKRWSHPGTWIVAVPAFLAVGLACADRVCDLLPNLI